MTCSSNLPSDNTGIIHLRPFLWFTVIKTFPYGHTGGFERWYLRTNRQRKCSCVNKFKTRALPYLNVASHLSLTQSGMHLLHSDSIASLWPPSSLWFLSLSNYWLTQATCNSILCIATDILSPSHTPITVHFRIVGRSRTGSNLVSCQLQKQMVLLY